jgi:penicillin-binding protein 1C
LELTTAYAALARGGSLARARLHQGQPLTAKKVMNPAACRLVADALADDAARAPAFGMNSVLSLPFAAAVKTGTSQKHRDNWCLGFTSEYTVGVWAGNYQGDPMDGVSGTSGAGPIWRQVMLLLHKDSPGKLPPWPKGIVRKPVKPQAPGQASFWEYFAQSEPERRQQPAMSAAQPGLELISPPHGAVYALDPDLPPNLQVITCQAAIDGPFEDAKWRFNGHPLQAGDGGLKVRMPLRPGKHSLEILALVSGKRLRKTARFTVLP